jgi:hypothetical protein
MRQPDLFAPAPARVVLDGPALRDKGHQRVQAVDSRASDWLSGLLDVVCVGQPTVTSDDLQSAVEAAPYSGLIGSILQHPNLIGATIRAAAVAGKLRDTGRCIKTTRVAGQGRKITVWEVVR